MTGSQLPWLAPNQRMATESGAASSEVNRHLEPDPVMRTGHLIRTFSQVGMGSEH